jgi:hypothetical protein
MLGVSTVGSGSMPARGWSVAGVLGGGWPRLVEAAADRRDGAVEALAVLVGSAVLLGGLLPPAAASGEGPLRIRNDNHEADDLLAEAGMLGCGELAEAPFGGLNGDSSGGELPSGLVAFPPSAGTGSVLEPTEADAGVPDGAGGMADRAVGVDARAGGQVLETPAALGQRLLRLSEWGSGGGRRAGVGGGGEEPSVGVSQGGHGHRPACGRSRRIGVRLPFNS